MSHTSREQVERIAAQIGSSLMPDSDRYINRFTVKSHTSSSIYTVSQRRSDDVWCCSCRGWIHHRKCKHVTDILRRLATLPVAAQFDPDVLQMLASARTAYLDLEGPAVVQHPTVVGRQVDL